MLKLSLILYIFSITSSVTSLFLMSYSKLQNMSKIYFRVWDITSNNYIIQCSWQELSSTIVTTTSQNN